MRASPARPSGRCHCCGSCSTPTLSGAAPLAGPQHFVSAELVALRAGCARAPRWLQHVIASAPVRTQLYHGVACMTQKLGWCPSCWVEHQEMRPGLVLRIINPCFSTSGHAVWKHPRGPLTLHMHNTAALSRHGVWGSDSLRCMGSCRCMRRRPHQQARAGYTALARPHNTSWCPACFVPVPGCLPRTQLCAGHAPPGAPPQPPALEQRLAVTGGLARQVDRALDGLTRRLTRRRRAA
jgi:hypothetical protein